MGYGWVQVSMGPGLLSLPLWVILILPFAKILTTGLSIGSGGSGGISVLVWSLEVCWVQPSGGSVTMFIPGIPDTPAPFVIVGMMALFGGIAHAPLAVMLMVAENSAGNLSMLAPAMIAVSISSILIGKTTIYTSQVDTRADSPAHRLQLSFPLLSTLVVRQAMSSPPLRLAWEQTVALAELQLANHVESGVPVIDQHGNLQGILTIADIQRLPFEERKQRLVKDAMNKEIVVVSPDDTLDEALEQLTSNHVSWVPVVNTDAPAGEQRVLGTLSAVSIVHLYRETLAKDSRRMRGLVDGTVMIETTMTANMRLTHVMLRDAQLPAECLVVSIRRDDGLLFLGEGR